MSYVALTPDTARKVQELIRRAFEGEYKFKDNRLFAGGFVHRDVVYVKTNTETSTSPYYYTGKVHQFHASDLTWEELAPDILIADSTFARLTLGCRCMAIRYGEFEGTPVYITSAGNCSCGPVDISSHSDGPGSTGPVCNCSDCPSGMPYKWALTVSGAVDSGSCHYSEINGTVIVSHLFGCLWKGRTATGWDVQFGRGGNIYTADFTKGGTSCDYFFQSLNLPGHCCSNVDQWEPLSDATIVAAPYTFACNCGSSSSGSGGGGVSCPCLCSPIPETLHATITGCDGGCTAGSFPIFWNGVSGLGAQWQGSTTGTGGACNGDTLFITLTCTTSGGVPRWNIETGCGAWDINGGGGFPTVNCSPLQWTLAGLIFCGSTCTVNITE